MSLAVFKKLNAMTDTKESSLVWEYFKQHRRIVQANNIRLPTYGWLGIAVN